MPHNLYLLHYTLFAVLLAESGLFGEGLHCEIVAVDYAFHQVDCGEVASPYLFYRLELLVET